ncbi:hypothetical protein UCDDA912_g05950 [Diaporthe ampelina]|uniref:Uncharacterized protein n=1 Tax=Diaporthe ampelina TaxID=1214573 RepID=A0A0G2HG31_9PEZI|nr:hypothetical protein UCDDA912_g05950 [Diaporthe ampelina]
MFKTRFKGWGWRKNIKLTPGLEPKEVQDTPYEDSVRPGTQIRLANGQIVDTSRLQRHFRRKRVYPTVPITAVVRPPDSHHLTEAVFSYTRAYVFGRHESEIRNLTEALSILTIDQPSTGRWFNFTNEINNAMKQNNVSQALVRLRRAPDEVAIMFKSQPSTTLCNIFMLVVQLNSYAEATGADAEQFRVLLKSLLKYAASLGFSGALGVPSSHPLPHLMQSLAVVPHSELNEVAIRAWKVTCQAWAEMVFSNYFAAIGAKSLATWLTVGDRGEMDGMWFFQLIEGIIDEQLSAYQQLFGVRDFRYIESLHGKAELLSFIDMAAGADCYKNPRIIALYQQMLAYGAQGPRRTAALKFLARGKVES